MSGSDHEIEVKLRFDSVDDARRILEGIGATPTTARLFEENTLFDQPGEPLKAAHKLLRLRSVEDRSWLTFKAPVPGEHRHKVRLEYETGLEDSRAMRLTLEALGYRAEYRYQKYRTTYELSDLQICLDETPIGCFVELEGAPEAIDRTAAAMGFSSSGYIRESYRELHIQAGEPTGDLVF